MRALLIDLDGVVYEGDQPVPGARETLAWLEENQVPRLFLTNTTSRPRSALVDKLGGMGITVSATQILTPPVAAKRWLREHVDGAVALFVPPATADEFAEFTLADPGTRNAVAAVLIGDYGEHWNFTELNRAFRLLMETPQPALVALGMTRYWRAPDGVRLDTAPFVVALQHASSVDPVILGKPAVRFFEAALSELSVAAEETFIVGDDIHADVCGAQNIGIRGILVKTGKFRESDLDLKTRPYAVLDSIADLPDWWVAEQAPL